MIKFINGDTKLSLPEFVEHLKNVGNDRVKWHLITKDKKDYRGAGMQDVDAFLKSYASKNPDMQITQFAISIDDTVWHLG